MDDEQYFKKYQWITADVQRADDRDNRPESYRIRADGIELGDTIGTGKAGDWRERAGWVLQRQNLFESVEALQARQAVDHTSLGIVRPKQIIQIQAETLSPAEHASLWRKYQEISAQLPLTLDDRTREARILTPPDHRFRIRFACDDHACTRVHKFGVLDWEIDALYFSLKKKYGEGQAKQKVVAHLQKLLTGADRDPRFFLGNISTHPHEFTIVGFWYPKKAAPSLLDAP